MHSDLEILIHAMMTENTGASMLDSGGAYGRNHERNAAKSIEDFNAEPAAKLEIYVAKGDGDAMRFDVSATANIWHKLTRGPLELNALCEAFNALPCENWDSDFCGVSAAGAEFLELAGLTPSGDAWNSYNWDSNLSQILQGQDFEGSDGTKYILLQVHGGCDARGGYTDAKLFALHSHAEPYDVPRDDSMFSVAAPEGTPDDESNFGYFCLDIRGSERTTHEGDGADDAYIEKFARAAFAKHGVEIESGAEIILIGDQNLDF